MDYVICRVNARVGAVVPIKDYLLETQNKHRHTCLNNYTAFKKILATQEILTMNVSPSKVFKNESQIIFRQIRGNYHLPRKQPKIRENKLIPL